MNEYIYHFIGINRLFETDPMTMDIFYIVSLPTIYIII